MLLALALLFKGLQNILLRLEKCPFTSSGLFLFVSGTNAKTYTIARAAKAAKRKYVPAEPMASCIWHRNFISTKLI